jgi:hypothetical protein
MRRINVFGAENPGRIDVSRAVGSESTAMYSDKIAVWSGNEADQLIFKRSTAVPLSEGEEGWENAV